MLVVIRDLNIFAVVIRSLEFEEREFTVVDENGVSFMCSLDPPRISRPTDGSPRDRQPYVMRWRAGLLGPGSGHPEAGWRVSLTRPLSTRPYETDVYELLSDPQEARTGAMAMGVQADVAPVNSLYPYEAELQEQDGTAVQDIRVALWSEREDHQNTGTYESFSGEAPVEFANMLGTNRRLDIGGKRYRITSSIVDFEGPRVKFDARRANA